MRDFGFAYVFKKDSYQPSTDEATVPLAEP
jgi:hypothetical protein